MVENEKVRVWYINGNDLKYSSKDIVKTKYNDIEIAVLKEDLKFNYQDFLIKDINNEYWALGIIPIRFENFEKATNNQFSNERKYCDEMLKKLGNMEEIKKFFNKKIKNGKWFNKCEIEYIYRYYGVKIDFGHESVEML